LPQLTCPSCKQQNDTDMAFCIFCGSTLKPGSISGRKPDVAGDSCQACGKSDPLNAKFCVFCGAQIIHPMPEVVEAPRNQRSGEANASASVSIITKAVAPARSTSAAAPIILVVLGTALGAALGTAAAWAMKPIPVDTKVSIPPGISILTKKRQAPVVIVGEDNKNFILGFTGSDGNFNYPEPNQNGYSVDVDNQAIKTRIRVVHKNALVDLTKPAGAP
jgi:hypothetical protein